MKNLIIVESPAKAKTIRGFLGKQYEVIASKGHIRDLPKFSFGIQIENQHFIPKYTISTDHQDIIKMIKKYAENADSIYIATDEDREGEAIGYHIAQVLNKDYDSFPRIVFHEITKNAIENALKSPRKIDIDKVNAQQARRLLDRIVGFKLSALVSSKIIKGLSAGRVQSAALKIIVDREREINAFKPIDFYSIEANFSGINAMLISFEGKKLKEQDIRDSAQAENMVEILKNDSFVTGDLEKKSKKTHTPPPFMTSTLQQTSSNLLGYSPSRTMSIAQHLYEGVQTHQGTMGIITYMRTDSLNIAKEAVEAARKKIKSEFGDSYLPAKPKIYTAKNKSAQEAHEAIRPTNLDFTPQIAKDYLKNDELKLYTLIYNRFLASQMEDAVLESQSIIFKGQHGDFKANGRKLIFDGFYRVTGMDDKDKLLPDLKENEPISPQSIESIKHTTQPPSRYSEASLIKTLESLGIGRPSTYAPTISILTSREYVKIEKKQLVPQENAIKVIEMLESHFEDIVDSDFTASLEDKLDEIAENKLDWQKLLWDFYQPFEQKISEGKTSIASQKFLTPTGESCPECNSDLVVRKSRYGEFVACSGYPKCKYIKPQEKVKSDEQDSQDSDEKCEKCGKPMVKKMGKNGPFLACSGYPECKNAKSLKAREVLEDVQCPECGGDIIVRSGFRGLFYGCSNYPKCRFISKHKPSNEKCPECGYMMAKCTLRGKELYRCIKCKTQKPC